MGLRSFLHRITAPPPARGSRTASQKLVCVVNQSLKMGKGKLAAQVGHAAVGAFLIAGASHPEHLEAWLGSGQKKICVKVPDASVFEELTQQAHQLNIPVNTVGDAGHTQIPAGSQTVLALGPYDAEILDTITGHLKLL